MVSVPAQQSIMARGDREVTYNKYDAKLLDKCPPQCVLFGFVWWIAGSGVVGFQCARYTLLLHKDISDEVVDDGVLDRRPLARPHDHTRGGYDFKCVQHVCGGGVDNKKTWELGGGFAEVLNTTVGLDSWKVPLV